MNDKLVAEFTKRLDAKIAEITAQAKQDFKNCILPYSNENITPAQKEYMLGQFQSTIRIAFLAGGVWRANERI